MHHKQEIIRFSYPIFQHSCPQGLGKKDLSRMPRIFEFGLFDLKLASHRNSRSILRTCRFQIGQTGPNR